MALTVFMTIPLEANCGALSCAVATSIANLDVVAVCDECLCRAFSVHGSSE
jgi:hypothetical protein